MNKLRTVLLIALLSTAALGTFLYLTFTGRIDNNPVSSAVVAYARPYPGPTNPKTVTMNCNYHGKNISVSETLYGSIDTYYSSSPEKRADYYAGRNANLVYSNNNDQTIKELATKIEAAGFANGLDKDQTLDLGACLLQSIPYDTAKAAKILGPNFSKYPVEEVIPRYPYETLYDFTGICTDKSFLGAAIFREMGYKTALLTFDTQKHMSLGVGVPAGYTDFGSSYAIIELTGKDFLVGDVPEVSTDAGLAISNIQTIPSGGATTSNNQVAIGNLSQVIKISDGTNYERIVPRVAIKQKITELKPQVQQLQTNYQTLEANLKSTEATLTIAESTYKINPSSQTYTAYINVYNRYQREYNAAQSAVDSYNNMVATYNSYVQKYQQF